MTAFVVVLVVAAILSWPPRSSGGEHVHAGAPGSRDGTVPGTRDAADEKGATVAEAADALTLLALALRSGCGPVEALDDVSCRVDGPAGRQLRAVAVAHRWGLDPDDCWRFAPAVWAPAALAWRAALTAGVSPAALVDRAADVLRDGESRRVETALARAGVLLVLPLGICFLPGFVATTVVPVVLQLLHGFAGSG